MPDLSPGLEELVLAERNASLPTQSDYSRVHDALLSRLGTIVAKGDDWATSAAPRSTSRFLAGKIIAVSAISIVLTLGGGAYYFARSQAVEAPTPTDHLPKPSTTTRSVLLPPTQTVSKDIPQSPATSANPSPVAVRKRSTARPSDSLSDEVAILSRAEAELHRGRAENALRALNEHERKYPKGILAEERTAARIQALCLLNRRGEANALLSRLKPGSLHGEGAQHICNPSSAAKRSSPASK